MAEGNDMSTNVTATLVDRHIAATRGGRNALRYGQSRYTFHDVAALMNRAGNMLRGLGVQADDHVLLLVPPSPALIAGLLGAMKIGAVPVVMTVPIDGGSIARCLAAAKPAVIVAHRSHLEAVESAEHVTAPVVVVGEDAGAHMSFVELVREAPSSLSGAPVATEAMALALFGDGGLITASHGQIAALIAAGEANGGEIEGWSLTPALRAFASCEEAALPS